MTERSSTVVPSFRCVTCGKHHHTEGRAAWCEKWHRYEKRRWGSQQAACCAHCLHFRDMNVGTRFHHLPTYCVLEGDGEPFASKPPWRFPTPPTHVCDAFERAQEKKP